MPGHGAWSHEEACWVTELQYERLPSHCRALDVGSRPETTPVSPRAQVRGHPDFIDKETEAQRTVERTESRCAGSTGEPEAGTGRAER